MRQQRQQIEQMAETWRMLAKQRERHLTSKAAIEALEVTQATERKDCACQAEDSLAGTASRPTHAAEH